MRRLTLLMVAAACGGPAPDAGAEPADAAFRRAAERALPGVVFVEVQTAGALVSAGSGFVFEPGHIVTNNHLVEGAVRVRVVTRNRRDYAARLVGRDPNTDLAVLRVDATDLPVLAAGPSDSVRVGDPVLALGYPLQLGATATAGIVSAKGRNLQILTGSAGASAPLEHFIQTDAAINQGNSGGPLVDLAGRVIGVNTAIASPTGYYSGYGFAIPMDLARRVAGDLIRYGEVRRPRLGVSLEDVDAADATVYGLGCVCGAEVIRVVEGTAAEAAGVRLGDVIRALDGTRVDGAGDLLERLARSEPGATVRLGVLRAGEAREITVTLGQFDPPVRADPTPAQEPVSGRTGLGFTATEPTAALARRLGFPDGGVIVAEVDPTHPAGRTRLQPGVRVESVDGRPIASLDDLRSATERLEGGEAVSVIVRGPDGGRTIINYRVPR